MALDDFCGSPAGVETTHPEGDHWTREYTKGEKEIWKRHARELHELASELDFCGYIEAENVPVEYRFDNLDANPDGPVARFPVDLIMGKLSKAEGERFKKAEIHVSMKRQSSNPNLQAELIRAGFLPVYWRDEIIFTAQGFNSVIKELEQITHTYILKVGGGSMVQILREHIADEVHNGFSLHRVEPEELNSIVRRLVPAYRGKSE